MIAVEHVTKSYGKKRAVDDLSFTVNPGVVTGFLGPNGAGKSTTMRMIVGLDRPDSGSVSIDGKPYVDHIAPLCEVGALLEARAIHPGRSAYNHLLALATTTGIPRRRITEVLDLVGLATVGRKPAGAFSLGMGQRLGIAAALTLTNILWRLAWLRTSQGLWHLERGDRWNNIGRQEAG